MMKQTDAFGILGHIDASLAMLQSYEGRLNGSEVRIRSLLAIVRNELTRDIIENTEPEKIEGDAGAGYDGHDVAESSSDQTTHPTAD